MQRNFGRDPKGFSILYSEMLNTLFDLTANTKPVMNQSA